jgi:hypothetical protein
LGRYFQLSVGPHCVEEKRHAAAAIGRFAEGVINLARRNYRFRISTSHPLDGGADGGIRDMGEVADDHAAAAFLEGWKAK